MFQLTIFTSCTSGTLYIYIYIYISIAFYLCAIGWVLFYSILALIIYLFLCNFGLLFSVVLVWALTKKVKNNDYFGVLFVVNQDYLNFSCNLKFLCSYSRIKCKLCTNYSHIVGKVFRSGPDWLVGSSSPRTSHKSSFLCVKTRHLNIFSKPLELGFNSKNRLNQFLVNLLNRGSTQKTDWTVG